MTVFHTKFKENLHIQTYTIVNYSMPRFFLDFCLSVLKCDWRFEMRVVANAQSLWGLELSSHIHKSSNNTGAMSPRS